MIIPHVSEIYRCNDCLETFKLNEITNEWICPKCGIPLSIKIEIGDHIYSCNRLQPTDLKINNLITIDKKEINLILDISANTDSYRLALKNYGVYYCHKNDFLLVINGAWIEY
jgi:DNA-directed RNA polymerase subunit RPC12/RpoP